MGKRAWPFLLTHPSFLYHRWEKDQDIESLETRGIKGSKLKWPRTQVNQNSKILRLRRARTSKIKAHGRDWISAPLLPLSSVFVQNPNCTTIYCDLSGKMHITGNYHEPEAAERQVGVGKTTLFL